ncbi:thiol:disulfide interchange protein DsbA/DsbL [Curvibacter sp. CHRR-16]|uniref:thiol:disulfide interchange protein DsbA/DsbL n=1 Tax=Curvibacter sp. CHRR-16 TaxID=2835872 RepID=UPI001BDA3FC3|nr:thiol:disulfide interchange protein DsbA/DsbL [Curvibacter sp. CHRR-16]MBT0569698.1 thiol:disulfide interchange protein DsbA/DsbL [Curvibacter sp. CHRR-16]
MKRREFAQLAGAGLATTAGSTVWAQGAKPVAGTDYQVIDPRAPVEAPAGKIEVVEFFWFNCPHCNAFEPTLQAWIPKLPKDVHFRRVPVAFRDDFVPQQRFFYALETMGLVEKMQAKVFAAIHVERQDLTKPDAIINWVAKQGIDKNAFTAAYNSFATATKAGKATQLQNAYKIEGVPSLGVAGRFLTDAGMAGGMGRALQIVQQLVDQVRAKPV